MYEWVDFSKFGQIWAKIGSNLRKFWKKLVILFKIWPKIELIGIWMGLLFLEKLVFVWVYVQILWRHIPTKTKLEYAPGPWSAFPEMFENFLKKKLYFPIPL